MSAQPKQVETPSLVSELHSESPGNLAPSATAQGATDENLYLIGRPTLKDFLRYIRSHALNPLDEGALTDEWHAANRAVASLEKEEAGVADDPPIRKLGHEYEPLLTEFLKDPLVQNSFNTVPTEVAFVELDRLAVYQKHIDLTFVAQLKAKLETASAMTDEQIFRVCLPYDHPQPPVKWSRMHQDKFVFVSPSNDLRFLRVMPMESRHIQDYPPPGNLVGIVGLAVGFGSNFMNALYAEKRLVLNNGSHRAYALREMGISHVPCIIQHVSSREELDVVGASDISDHPDLYLKSSRPPMLKDYFNSKLRKIIPVHRRLRQVTVKFEIDEGFIPAV